MDKDQKVWVATEKAVALYENSKWVIYNAQNANIPDDKISAIFQNDEKQICIATEANYAKFVSGQWEIYQVKKVARDNEILYTKIDGAGNTWYVTRNEFVLLKGGEEKHFAAIDEFQKQAQWFHLFTDGRIILWITLGYTGDEVFYVFDKKEWILQKMPKIANWKNGFIEQYTIDNHEVLWFASLYNGLKSFDGVNWKLYKKSEGFFSIDILSVFNDSKNRLWVGSKDNGLVMKE
jgi:ligand-binding sensor domain-containing protein